MIRHPYYNLFNMDSIEKQVVIDCELPDGSKITIDNTMLHGNDMTIKQSICSEDDLVLGTCESSSINFRVSNVGKSLKNAILKVNVYLDGDTKNPFNYGEYKVYDDVLTADRSWRDIVAYDYMADILSVDCSEWYNNLFATREKITLREFRGEFHTFIWNNVAHIGRNPLEQLPNDDVILTKTVTATQLTGKMVLNAICELNGCFGTITSGNVFKYVFIKESSDGLYPIFYPSYYTFPGNKSDHEDLVPARYENCEYADYKVKNITGIAIRMEDNDVGVEAGNTDNLYVIKGNFLVYGKGIDELNTIANNILSVVKDISYVPINLVKQGNPCIELGDSIGIRFSNNKTIHSFVINRELSGIQMLKDNIVSNGKYERENTSNSIKDSIIALQGKSNRLERDVEHTLSIVEDLSKDVYTEIEQLADSVGIRVIKGDVVTELSVDKNGIGFSGNKVIFETNNFSLDEDGNAEFSGDVTGATITGATFNNGDGTFKVYENGHVECSDIDITEGDLNGCRIVGGSINIADTFSVNPGQSTYVEGDLWVGNEFINDNLKFNSDRQSGIVWDIDNVDYYLLRQYEYDKDKGLSCTALGNNTFPTRIYGESVWSSKTISVSDKRLKENFDSLEKYEKMYMDLKPISYNFKSDKNKKIAFGMTTQDVEDACKNNGIDVETLAIYNTDSPDEYQQEYVDDGIIHGLSYQELISLNTHMIQKAYAEIEKLKQEIKELKEKAE